MRKSRRTAKKKGLDENYILISPVSDWPSQDWRWSLVSDSEPPYWIVCVCRIGPYCHHSHLALRTRNREIVVISVFSEKTKSSLLFTNVSGILKEWLKTCKQVPDYFTEGHPELVPPGDVHQEIQWGVDRERQVSHPGHPQDDGWRILPALRGSPSDMTVMRLYWYISVSVLLWVTIAAVDFINIGDNLDTLADDEEDDDHDEDPRHTCLLNISFMVEPNSLFYSNHPSFSLGTPWVGSGGFPSS